MDKDKVSKYRAEVIERFINVEWIINAIISQYYLKKVRKSFLFEVLCDEHFSFALRRSILKKIIKNVDSRKLKGIEKDMNQLNRTRNYFAHCGQEFIVLTDDTPKRKIIDPRKPEEELDFESLYDEFMTKVSSVEKYLAKLLHDLGGTLVTNLPKT